MAAGSSDVSLRRLSAGTRRSIWRTIRPRDGRPARSAPYEQTSTPVRTISA